jgi:hypothetical protein
MSLRGWGKDLLSSQRGFMMVAICCARRGPWSLATLSRSARQLARLSACEVNMLVGEELPALLGRETSNFSPPGVEAISVGWLA